MLELVLPCYNEAKSLAAILDRATAAATAAGFAPETFRLILVENGSTDESRSKLRELERVYGPWMKTVLVDQNQGYGYGLKQGLAATSAPVVAWSHADQQCDPADVFKAYSELKKFHAPALVKGRRGGRDWKDRVVSFTFAGFSRAILGFRRDEINAQPKVFHRALLDKVAGAPNTFAFDLYMLYQAQKMKFKIVEIPVLFPPRVHGLSNWSANFFSRYKTIYGMIKYMYALRKSEGRIKCSRE